MIKYNLKCVSKGCFEKEPFDGWFENINAYEKQKKIGYLTCPYCGGTEVIKNLMSPSIQSFKKNKNKLVDEKNIKTLNNSIEDKNNSTQVTFNEAVTVLRSIKKEIESKAEYVGNEFVKEARAIKCGDAKSRAIYGHADSDKIEELKDEGIEITSIPWIQDDH